MDISGVPNGIDSQDDIYLKSGDNSSQRDNPKGMIRLNEADEMIHLNREQEEDAQFSDDIEEKKDDETDS